MYVKAAIIWALYNLCDPISTLVMSTLCAEEIKTKKEIRPG